jgi:co-chaperonin GroES (HSP10)
MTMSNVVELKPHNCGITPAGHRVLVQPDEYMKSYQGVIVMPPNLKERSSNAQTAGTVIALGTTAYAQREFGNGVTWCKPGDRVMFARYGGTQIKGKDGETYRIIVDEDILALLDDEVSFDLDSTY